MTLKAVRWIVSGRVQGVGFRWFVQTRAEALGVRGWARNLPDGSVEVVVAASPEILGSFEQAVRKGPRGAAVAAISAEDIPHEVVDTKSFIIKH